jgi:hypothetical protein
VILSRRITVWYSEALLIFFPVDFHHHITMSQKSDRRVAGHDVIDDTPVLSSRYSVGNPPV